MKHLVVYFVIFFWLAALTAAVRNKEVPPDEVEIRSECDSFLYDWEASASSMLTVCDYYGVKYPRIVTAQAILESNNFKSEIFKKYNNPFGLYNSRKKDYFKFKHWTDAVPFYIKTIEYKHKEDKSYYQFLKDLLYATDNNYIKKIQAIEATLPP